MSLLRRLHVTRFTPLLGGAGRAAAAVLLLLAGLTAPGAAPALAAPGWAAPAAVAPLAPQGSCLTTVTNTNNGGAHSLRGAVFCANFGPIVRTVTFSSSVANSTINLTTGEISITHRMTIDASGAPGVIVDAGGSSRVFNIAVGGPVTVTNLVLQNGKAATGNGGAIVADAGSRLVLDHVQVLSSSAPAGVGGGLYTNGRVVLTDTDFINNVGGLAAGGALVNDDLLATGGQFQGNKCTVGNCIGGGLVAVSPTLSGTNFISNTSLGLGGGLFAGSTATVLDSAFSGNQSAGSGGAIAITSTTQLTLANVTLSDNQALDSGGGLYAGGNTTADLWNVTVADNEAFFGSGLFAEAGATVGVTNTLFSNNLFAGSPDDCDGAIASGTNNLEWPGNTCAAAGPTAGFSRADPLLAPLVLNAPGTTPTRALLTGSAARDAGDLASCAAAPVNNLDQRGVVRPDVDDVGLGATCDIGAYEAGPILVFLPLVSK